MRILIIDLPEPDQDGRFRLKRISPKTLTIDPYQEGEPEEFVQPSPTLNGDEDAEIVWLEWIVFCITNWGKEGPPVGEEIKAVLRKDQYRKKLREWITKRHERIPLEEEVTGHKSLETPSPEEFRERVEALHEKVGCGGTAAQWFAFRAYVHLNTVHRWMGGEKTPGGPVIALLEELERQV